MLECKSTASYSNILFPFYLGLILLAYSHETSYHYYRIQLYAVLYF